ncbi:MAG: lipid A deacylase LpxR family protein [Bacteroidales bacterium]|nr:lipid A deacylase LpxR family protein [Bacteroidales bacterium]
MRNSIIKIVFFLIVSIILLIPEDNSIKNSTSDIYLPAHNLYPVRQIEQIVVSIIPEQQTYFNSEISTISTTKIISIGKVENINSRKVKNLNYSKSDKISSSKKITYSNNKKNYNFLHNYYNTDTYLSFYFDNDIFNNTDYYYTNGIKFELINPIFSYSPIMRFLLSCPGNSINYYGISLVQNMYTPTNPDLGDIMINDRPFASYLYLGHFKISNDAFNKIRFTSELDIGVIGPVSLGGYFQSTIHEHEPLGWKYQVQNDVLVNYKVEIEKGLLSYNNFEFNGLANASLGTVYTNASIGFTSRFGKFEAYFEDLDITPYSKNNKTGDKFRYYFYLKGRANFIAYDATLQGGAINRNSTYIINSKILNRSVLQASMGFVFAYKIFSFEYEQFFLSPEFNTARPFLWGSVKTSFSL